MEAHPSTPILHSFEDDLHIISKELRDPWVEGDLGQIYKLAVIRLISSVDLMISMVTSGARR